MSCMLEGMIQRITQETTLVRRGKKGFRTLGMGPPSPRKHNLIFMMSLLLFSLFFAWNTDSTRDRVVSPRPPFFGVTEIWWEGVAKRKTSCWEKEGMESTRRRGWNEKDGIGVQRARFKEGRRCFSFLFPARALLPREDSREWRWFLYLLDFLSWTMNEYWRVIPPPF